MDLQVSSSDFAATYDRNEAQVVWTEVRADTETPVSAFLKLASDPNSEGGIKPFSFLFESVEGGATWGRYSIAAFQPDLAWRHKDGKTEISHNPLSDEPEFAPCHIASREIDAGNSLGAPLVSFERICETVKLDAVEGLPLMASGLYGYMGYDMVRHMEKLPNATAKVLDVPESLFVRPTIVLVFDRLSETLLMATPVHPSNALANEAYEAAAQRLSAVMDKLALGLPAPVHQTPKNLENLGEPKSNMTPSDYQSMVMRAKDYIAAGDIFQVVLSQRFELPFALPAIELYRSLRRINPSPYLFFLNFDGYAIAGSSPEVLVRLKEDKVTIRPIAGTRKRGLTTTEDEALAKDLLGDEKERAEHLMLLDLGRNDVGRVSKIGSVSVTEEFKIELYSHVMHIVSNVEGELAAGKTAMDALAAGFPAGTVSGAPKVRAMEIIEEFEPHKRGIYAGAVGYVDSQGEMDTCIALRTAVVKDGTLYIQAGAGVVADSDPLSEHEECENKARALVRAAQDAVRFANRKAN